jgi:hypothetical protein
VVTERTLNLRTYAATARRVQAKVVGIANQQLETMPLLSPNYGLQLLQQYFPYRCIDARAYNADNRRGVAGVADVGLKLKVLPCKGSKGPEHMLTDTFKPFQGLPFGRLKTAQTRKLLCSEVTA